MPPDAACSGPAAFLSFVFYSESLITSVTLMGPVSLEELIEMWKTRYFRGILEEGHGGT